MDKVFSLKNKTLKNTGKWKKILEKSGNFVNPEKWEPCILGSIPNESLLLNMI